MEHVIETESLTKTFRGCDAVKQLSLVVPRGSVSGFLGLNGSGKSTTLKMLMGAIHPTSGSGRVLGHSIDCQCQSVELRKRVAFVSEDKRLYDYMTVGQIIYFTKSLFPDWRNDLEREFHELFPIPSARKIRKLSKGMRTQLALLLGIARNPEVLILDEPTEGLDPAATEAFLQLVLKVADEGTTVFFSSHQIAEVEQISTHLFILDRGELLLTSPVDRLRKSWTRISAELPPHLKAADMELPGVHSIRTNGAMTAIFTSDGATEIMNRLRSGGASNVGATPASLKDVFLQTLQRRTV